MKRIPTIIIAAVLAMLTATLMPVQVFADSIPEYISAVKVFMDNCDSATEEGYTILCEKDANGNLKKDKKGNPIPVDLNQGAGGGWGSKGDNAVYLGYKTTTDYKEAITDLALMNMKGGYDVAEYDALMDTYIKSQLIPFVENFIEAVKEYRINYASENPNNSGRANYVHDFLNKYTDDDCGGAALGDLLLNETKFEMGDEAYNALSNDEKKNHCDIVTLLAQSNGHVTLMLENLITRATDTNDTSWIERFADTTYDDIIDAMDLTPTDAGREIAKLYDDDAQLILDKWDAFQSALVDYEAAQTRLDNYDAQEVADAYARFNALTEDSTQEEIDAATEAFNAAQAKESQMLADSETITIRNYLADIDYSYDGEDTTMLDFFCLEYEEITENYEWVYPLVASLSDGQRAGLEFVTLPEMIEMATTDPEDFDTEEIRGVNAVSAYDGVNRDIYRKGGVALTSDALRGKVTVDALGSKSLSGCTIAMIVISSLVTAAFLFSVGVKVYNMARHAYAGYVLNNMSARTRSLASDLHYTRITSFQNSKFMNGFVRGLGVAFVLISAATVLLAWNDMRNYYKVDFTPIPHYMVDEMDITGYNSKGEKIVIKNQSAYYTAAECNRKKSADYYDSVGICADMNGDVGRQWLALYYNKNEALEPILANSLKAVVDSKDIPAGYKTGVHMFGSDAAFNLNSGLYDWNQSAKSVFVYYKTDNTVPKTAGSNFSGGTLAVAGGAGLAIGALATALGVSSKRKNGFEAAA